MAIKAFYGFWKAGRRKNPEQLLLRELRREAYWAQHVCCNNKENMLNLSLAFYFTIDNTQIEKHKSQWEDLKDSLNNVCIVHGAITPLQMWASRKNKNLTIVLINSISLSVSWACCTALWKSTELLNIPQKKTHLCLQHCHSAFWLWRKSGICGWNHSSR